MFNRPGNTVNKRLQSLEEHLKQENPVLLSVVQSYRELDKVGRRMGLLDAEESYASRISWWPLISVLGTFSAGKSSFINYTLGFKLQLSGNQAVDDKFTVICFSSEEEVNVLPGFALDADPRFPFYQISDKIERAAEGEGRRVDAYLQLKTCPSEKLRGKIFIDSPGFDADAQRTSTLRITDHIVDLSDLVLVFFDARHPEPGAMHDTLEHLVANTIKRPDSGKFLYVLNQIDTAAKEDNPEEVFGAWQRALASQGLTAGRFYSIYNPEVSVPIDDPALRQRFESKRDNDLGEIKRRIRQVEVERAYRIVGNLEKTAHDIEERIVPRLQELQAHWRKYVLWADAGLFGLALALLGGMAFQLGWFSQPPAWFSLLTERPLYAVVAGAVLLGLVGWLHFSVRGFMSRRIVTQLLRTLEEGFARDSLVRAFRKTSSPWRSLFAKTPAGWGGGSRKRIARVVSEADQYVQELNDQFTNPSGGASRPQMAPVAAAAPTEPVAPPPVVDPFAPPLEEPESEAR